MKKLLAILLALLILTACGAKPAPEDTAGPPEKQEETESPTEAFGATKTPEEEKTPEASQPPEPLIPPEPAKVGPVSAEAIVTEGRAPAENYTLPEGNGEYDMQRWWDSGEIGLLAEAEDAAFYGLPPSEQFAQEKALIRWGDSLAEFEWYFATPRMYLPLMAVMDLDGDGADELIVLTYSGSGTGVSIYDLHVLEKNPDGSITAYTMPDSLWQEQLAPMIQLEQTDEKAVLIWGEDRQEFDPVWVPDQVEITTGYIAEFQLLPDENTVLLQGAVDLWQTIAYVAQYTADVAYKDGVFTLSQYHLQEF